MKKVLLLISVLVVVVIFGCTPAIHSTKVQDVNAVSEFGSRNEVKTEVTLPLEHFQLVGIEKTSWIASGKFQSKLVTLSHRLLGEWDIGRIVWYGWAISPDGKEFVVPIYLWRINYFGELQGIAMIQNEAFARPGTKMVILSTQLEKGYDCEAREFDLNSNAFLLNQKYRSKLNDQQGSEIVNLPKSPINMKDVIATWHEHPTTDGKIILSKYTYEDMQFIASFDSQMDFIGKFIATSNVSIPIGPNPALAAAGLAQGLLIDILRAQKTPSVAPNYGSMVSRQKMRILTEWIGAMYVIRMKEMNEANESLFLDNVRLTKMLEGSKLTSAEMPAMANKRDTKKRR